MPRQVGIISLIGTFGEYSFYLRKGHPVIRRKGGPSKGQIMRSARMKPVRDQMKEFGGYAAASKNLKEAMASVMFIRDASFHNRTMSLCSSICKQSEETNGARAIAMSKFGATAIGLEINAVHPFASVCKAGFDSTPSHDRKTSRVQTTVNVEHEISPPKGTVTHFRFMHLLCLVPDMVFKPKTKKYHPVGEADSSRITYSDYIPLQTKGEVSVTLKTALPVDTVPATSGVLELIGIEFYNHERNTFQEKAGKRALVVHAAW